MIKLKDLLKEDYAVNVQDTRNNKKIQSAKFTLKADANLYIKDMMKKHKLKRQKGFWGNPKTGVEMLTNFQESMMINMKDLIKQQNTEIRKQTGMIKEENLNEVDFGKIKLPSVVNRFLDKFVDSMKGANLNRMKRAAILYKVIDAAGMTPQQLMADIQKIKTAMKND